jgi:cystathionine gamma-synthase
MAKKQPNAWSGSTLAAQALRIIDETTGAVVPGIEPSTTFARGSDYELPSEFKYSRYENPTTKKAEQVLAALEGAQDAMLFNSGLAAVAAVFELVRPGQGIVAPQIMYHGAQDWLRRLSETRGIEVTYFDQTDPDALAASLATERATLIWVETPVNPTWDVIDIQQSAQLAHEAGATLAVDCTVSTPCTTNALELGADFVFHSATKYLGGHSDLTAGGLVCASRDARWEEIASVRKLMGSILSPFDAWLLIRGMRTLFVRYERASNTAMAIARYLEDHPGVERVLYPGLETHPGHEIAKRQMKFGFGGMVSFLIRGDAEDARRVASSMQIFIPATSLGGVESLIEHRKSVEGPHSQVQPNLLRLSVGIEDANDLICDLRQALDQL